MDKSYTISEVADKLSLNDKTLRRWEESGKFKSSRTLGNQRRYSIEDLQILDAIKHGIIDSQADLLTLNQAASLAGVVPTTIKRWEDQGKIHPFVTAGRTYYPRTRLLAKLDELSQEPAAPVPQISLEPTPARSEAKIPHERSDIGTARPQTPSLSLEKPAPNHILTQYLPNFVLIIVIISIYHLLVIAPQQLSSPAGSADLADSADPADSLALLNSILEPGGNLNTQGSITASRLSLLPANTPANPAPGTLYYDSGTGTLRLYSDSWTDLGNPAGPTTPITLQNTELISGTGIIKKGASELLVNNRVISPDTPVVLTFTSDYSPAKKYWLELGQGSFTIYTDYPVGQNSTFTYLIMIPDSAPDQGEPSPIAF